jgi:hypothetical protein
MRHPSDKSIGGPSVIDVGDPVHRAHAVLRRAARLAAETINSVLLELPYDEARELEAELRPIVSPLVDIQETAS